jgi:uncharacterized protein YjbI with pentapeptide repeats/beta-lactamase regulating signal transducer with metallopeptidase domain
MPVAISAVEPVARIVVATLFNSLWEAALLALAVALIVRVFPNLNATTRYALWSIALVGSLLLPVATALPQITVQHPITASNTAASVQSSTTKQTHTPVKATRTHAAPVANVPVQTAQPKFRLPDRLHFALPEYVALALFILWALVTLAMLVRLAVNLWRLERLKTDALPLPVDYRDRLSRWTAAEKGGRDVRLCICDRIEVPVAVGLFDSMILIPQHLLETLSQEEMDQIMLHELAHLRRADDWTNGLQRVIQSLFFFNPAVLFIAQQLDVEREVACDDWVVHETREVRPYATCLTKMAEVTAWPHRAMAAPGVFVTRRGLSVRVERLLRAGRNVRTSIAFGPAGAAVAGLVVLFFILQTVAPSFAFTLPQAAQVANTLTTASGTQPVAKRAAHANAHVSTHAVQQPKAAWQKTIVYVVHDGKTAAPPASPVKDVPVQHTVKKTAMQTQTSLPKTAAIPPNPVLPPGFQQTINTVTAKSIHQALRAVNYGKDVATQNINCTGCDYSGQNLAGHNFRNQRMNGSDFSRANLQNADFSGAVLVGADFSHANLRGASFNHAVLTGCDLSHADLTDVNFDGAQVIGCDVNAKSLSAHQAAILLHACRSGCDFTGANLQNQDLHGLAISGADLSGADLRGANLSGVNFSGVDLSHARLDGANVEGARFTGCDFSGVDLRTLDMSKAMVVGSRFDR